MGFSTSKTLMRIRQKKGNNIESKGHPPFVIIWQKDEILVTKIYQVPCPYIITVFVSCHN